MSTLHGQALGVDEVQRVGQHLVQLAIGEGLGQDAQAARLADGFQPFRIGFAGNQNERHAAEVGAFAHLLQ
ncbi:hypothetical protein JOS77_31260 [Chromobacterium haemolyticum]|nr:hypothetical protein JOS77_31260 [Chromobacterium haemolyticum]